MVQMLTEIKGKSFYLIGIKGTGMAALAELLLQQGALVTGSDTQEQFYTDKVLQDLGISYFQGFDKDHTQPNTHDVVIRSSAYDDNHEEVKSFIQAGKIPMNYTQALGALSSQYDSSGIAGIHGKTTTTALAGTLAKALKLDASVLVGSSVANFGNRSTWTGGKRFFSAETCEYQRHFLDFFPRQILLTSVEEDHLDYFKDLEDIFQAFLSYIDRLPKGGTLIYCADDKGAEQCRRRAQEIRPDLQYISYGKQAEGEFKILENSMQKGQNTFTLAGYPGEFSLQVPGEHMQLDAAGSLALVDLLLKKQGSSLIENLPAAKMALEDFRGTRRRSEIIGEVGDILVMDDYGHHPRAIEMTLKGYKSFYSHRRLVVSFMSHTYSRSSSLLEEFAGCFSAADCLILHDIYSSARENYQGGLTGEGFYKRIAKEHPQVHYFPEIDQAKPFLKEFLQPGDLFLTLGAGNNWPLGTWVLEQWKT
ncbi:MAG: UDP-N-acetylmuramate--L-alanine ligase [Spirochaetaceae bacterium]|jgi:UDP-N-acetylmuramate--alanine ligase|nr:UDP-N-acetylmuramate--L-alanine ligase [Spirochaetaceae bacterium]